MGYVDENLIPGEQILFLASPHWACFITPSLPFLFALVLILMSLRSDAQGFYACLGLVFAFLGISEAARTGLVFFTTEFALTDRRIIAKTGLLRRRSLELLLAKVESIQVSQPLVGRILDYGTVIVVGTGGTHQPFRFISRPHELRRQVNARLASPM
jgi:uncharacterized membrane protein YdbT with pleckstrin-like domain